VIYGRGDGNDVIDHTSSSLTERDTLVLTDLNPEDVVFSRVGDDLLVTIKATGETIRDKLFFYHSDWVGYWEKYSYGFEVVKFANGTSWGRDQIQREAWLRGSDSGSTISGSVLSETLVGGQADDVLSGGGGSDTYIWRKGEGNDRFNDFPGGASDIDTLVLQDVQSDDVSLAYHGGTLLLTVVSTGEVLEFDHTVLGVDNLLTEWNKYSYGIDMIKFADGVTW
jgi:Ca2+-binding RTX toxin-like protein